MPKTETPRIAILGAGPIGLEALLYAHTLGLPATVFERGRIGEYLRRWGHVRLFSPFGMNATPLGRQAILADNPKHVFPDDGDCITGREHRKAYLEEKLAEFKETLRATRERIDAYSRSLIDHGVETTEQDIAWLAGLIDQEKAAANKTAT